MHRWILRAQVKGQRLLCAPGDGPQLKQTRRYLPDVAGQDHQIRSQSPCVHRLKKSFAEKVARFKIHGILACRYEGQFLLQQKTFGHFPIALGSPQVMVKTVLFFFVKHRHARNVSHDTGKKMRTAPSGGHSKDKVF